MAAFILVIAKLHVNSIALKIIAPSQPLISKQLPYQVFAPAHKLLAMLLVFASAEMQIRQI
jgi:hypothetical protein